MRYPIIFNILFSCSLVLMLLACGGGGGTSSDDEQKASTAEQSLANAGAAIVAVFSQASETSRFLAQDDEDHTTCNSIGGGPSGVTSSAQGTPGTYGAVGQQVSVSATDFCINPSSGAENSGNVLFASYEITGSLTATCSDGSSVSITGGSGIWRETDTHSPEIYGSFVAAGTSLHCTIFLQKNDQGIVDSSQCSDSSGTTVEVFSPVTCTIN